MDIKTLVSRGPGAMLELMPEPEAMALARTISAFANGIGGTIIVGMDSHGRVRPSGADYLEPVLERALRMCTPQFRKVEMPEWESTETPDGMVAAITVRPTPYQVSVTGEGTYVREGAANLLQEGAETARIRRLRPSFEEEIVPGATVDDFDKEVLEEYQRNRVERGPRGESFTREELLRDVGAIDPSGLPTAAGILLFGRHPQHFFPQVGVVIVRFRGKSIRDAIASSEGYSRRFEVVGPAARLVERTWDVLYKEIHQEPLVEGLERRETFEYPVKAVREAVVNAVCHRDYGIAGQRVEIRLFSDRMEIMSPGGLPGHITLDNILDEHYSRNPRLVRGLYYWGYIEELGQGIDIIYEVMQREHHPPPQFRDTARSFTVTLLSAIDKLAVQYGNDLGERQVRALRYLEDHERITNRQYQELCPDVSPETLRLDFRALVEKGILLKIGNKRGTYYVRK